MKSAFLASMSHELRTVHDLNNLLAVIKNNAVFITQDLTSVLGGDAETRARLLEDVGQISLATDRAIRLTDQLSASAVVTSDESIVPGDDTGSRRCHRA